MFPSFILTERIFGGANAGQSGDIRRADKRIGGALRRDGAGQAWLACGALGVDFHNAGFQRGIIRLNGDGKARIAFGVFMPATDQRFPGQRGKGGERCEHFSRIPFQQAATPKRE